MPATPKQGRHFSENHRSPKQNATHRDGGSRPSNLSEPISVQDRIRQWQSQGAADALPPDAVSVRSLPYSETPATPVISRPSSPDERRPQTTPRRGSGKWVQKSDREWIKEPTPKGSSAKRNSTNNIKKPCPSPEVTPQRPSRTERTPERQLLDDELRARNISSSRAERDERRRRRKDTRSRPADVSKGTGDGIRVYARSISRPPSEPCGEALDSGVESAAGDGLTNRGLTPEPTFALSENDNSEQVEKDAYEWKPSKYAETLGKAPQYQEDNDRLKNKKRDLLSKTKGMLTGKIETPTMMSNRLPSIEAWLQDQPDDPFVEEDGDVSQFAVEVPQPLKKHSRRKRSSVSKRAAEDTNKIWESVSPKASTTQKKTSPGRLFELVENPRGDGREQGRRQFSFEDVDEEKAKTDSVQKQGDTTVEDDTPVSIRRRDRATRRQKRSSVTSEQKNAIPLSELAQPVLRESARSQPESPTKSKPLPKPPPYEATSESNVASAPDMFKNESPGLKRRLTTHEDLLSVLSQQRSRKSVRSTRGTRRRQRAASTNNMQEILQAMQQDESKYIRELRTLVDGVTPVLLQSLLSKTDSVAAAGLFSESSQSDMSFTKPVIEMGVALEKLKSLHSRIPLQNVDSLLHWAQSAHKSYSDYIKAWRLGFQGVIVNLAPLDASQPKEEEVMARDTDGDVIDAEGKKVDVAYLQKRPLVRLKKLAKDLCAIHEELSGNAVAAKVAHEYADLTELAKRRHREEQGRLEDEAAAQIDTTKTRDLKSMGPAATVTVEQTRRVRARDCFGMTLYHSTGQRMDCRIEMVLRDNHSSQAPGGDVLICQMEDECKWLLFPPVDLNKISSRKGEWGEDLVVMIRGTAGIGQAWSEMLVLIAEDHEAAAEWLNMLGSNPLPPKLSRLPSFLDRRTQDDAAEEPETATAVLNESALANLSSDVDIPIGEPSIDGKRVKRQTHPKKGFLDRALPKLNLGGGLQKKTLPDHYVLPNASATHKTATPSMHSSDRSTISDSSSLKPLPKLAPTSEVSKSSAPSQLNYSPERVPEQQSYSPQKSNASNSSVETLLARPQSAPDTRPPQVFDLQGGSNAWISEQKQREEQPSLPKKQQPTRPEFSRAISSTPSNELPTIAKIRPSPKPAPVISTPLTESIRDQWASLSGHGKKQRDTPKPKKASKGDIFTEDVPEPPTQAKRSSLPAVSSPIVDEDSPPPPPPHRVSMPIRPQSNPSTTPYSSPLPHRNPKENKGLSSSPLKHEYAPSTSASESDSDSEDFSDDDTTATSEDMGSEIKDQAMPLVPIGIGTRKISKVVPKSATVEPSAGTRTLQPSDSASQGPYRRAPPPSAYPADQKKRTIAMVCSWSDAGVWEPLVDDECSIVVSPGTIQAFKMTAAHSQPMEGAPWQLPPTNHTYKEEKPLVEFELTPIVPLRKGTALDITIRSPPTINSKMQTTNNIMFRSRTVLECDQLYNMINWARCNNPTYQALLKSRPQEEPVSFATNVQHQRSRSWFSFGSKEKTSYRASSQPPPPSMGESDASATSMSSAFSALKRFKKNSPFSLNRSSVVRRPGIGRNSGSLYSSSTGTGTGSGSSTPAPSQAGIIPGPNGPSVPATSAEAAEGGGMVNKMKIRLFVRRGQSWEALGPSDLTVLPAAIASKQSVHPGSVESTPPGSAAPSRRTSYVGPPAERQYRLPSSGNTPHRVHGDGREKRILITKHKNPGAVVLDELLGESCFEKVMQTGIAVNVWKEDQEVQHYGGVMTGRSHTYMMQFRTSAEATWVFNMCGTYRYGNAAPAA